MEEFRVRSMWMMRMLPSFSLALGNLTAKRGRTTLMIGAVALAASLIVAMSCAMKSVQQSMEFGLERILGAADARIIHQFGGRFDEAILEEVLTWPQVEHAAGRLFGSLTLVHADQRRDADGRILRLTPSAIGVDFEIERRFRELTLIAGRMPVELHEILLDAIAAEELEAGVGDELLLQRFGEPIAFTVAGIYQRERLIGMIQRAQIRLDRTLLAEATGFTGQLSSIAIQLEERADVVAFCARHEHELPDALTLEPAEMARAGFDRRIEASQLGIIVMTVLTFMCAAFIIVTAMTSSVIERQREMAMMRSIGASRAQLIVSQLIFGLFVGAIGAALGVPLGIGIAGALVWWFDEFLIGGLALHATGIVLGTAGAALAGLLAAAYPAWEAGRVSPLEAMSRRARPVRKFGIIVTSLFGLALIVAQLVLFITPESPEAVFYSYVYVGLPVMHIGYFILAVPMLLLVIALISRPVSRLLLLPADMLGQSARSTPYRNGFTAGALMVGISILVSTWSGGQSLMHDWLGKIEFADGFAYHPTGIRPEQQRAIAQLPFVEAYCPISYLPLRVIGQRVFGVEGVSPANVVAVGFDPEVFFAVNAVEWLQGEEQHAIRRLKEGDAVIVAERFLIARGISVGQTITLGAGRVERDFEIVGVVSSAGLDIATQVFGVRSAYMEYAVSTVFLDFDAVATHFDNRDAYLMQLNIAGDIADDEVRDAISEVAPGVRFRSGRWIIETINRVAVTLLAAQSAIAFIALFLACFGVGNVIIANIHSRRHEYGVLRAAGAQRGLLVRLILGEAGLIAVTGAVVGTALGLHLSWIGAIFYRDYAGIPLQVTIPVTPALIGWLILIVMALLVALPAALSIMRCTPSALLAVGRND
jgi:putative ABC transport system permease protein